MVAAKNNVELRECLAACVWRWMSVSVECESFWPSCVNRDREKRSARLEFACEKCFCFDSHLKCRLAGSLSSEMCRNVFKIGACPESRDRCLISWLAMQVVTWLQRSTRNSSSACQNTGIKPFLICSGFTYQRKLLPLIHTKICRFNLSIPEICIVTEANGCSKSDSEVKYLSMVSQS